MTDPIPDAQTRFRAIFDSAIDFAIIATDADGLVTDWNTGAARIFGWQAIEMYGQSVARIFTPEDCAHDRPATEMRTSLSDGRCSDERWHLRRDGSRFWACGEMMPLRAADGAHFGFLKIVSDRTAQAATATALRAAQGLNDLVLNSSRDCIVVLDLETRTLFVSPGGIESMEIADLSSVIGTSWLRVWTGADQGAARDAVARACAGGVGRFQGFCPTHAGTPKFWDVMISPLPGADGAPERLVSVGRDITDLKLVEQRLAVSEARSRTLTETLPQLVWTCRPDGSCEYLSRQWVEYTGVAESEQLGFAWLDLVIHPDDRDRTYAHWMGAVAGQHPYDIEFRIRRANGAYCWFKTRATAIRGNDGSIVQWFGTCTDIQDIVEARDLLARSREELERQVQERTRERDSAWKYSRDLQAVLDASGVIRAANMAWTTLLGWEPEEVTDKLFSEFLHPDDREPSLRAFDTARTSQLPVFENRYRHKDGSYRWISWVTSPEDGLIYASGRHATAEKEAAVALAATQAQLRQAQKMEAVGQLTGGLAHDFNNLLTGIAGSLELLKTRVAQGRMGDVDRYVTAAQGAAKRAAALTHRLLAFSRQQTLDPKPVDINRLVLGMEELVRRTVGPSIAVEVVGGVGLWPALADSHQLENALLNLCINARDAMPDGGRLTIETSNTMLDARAAPERELPPGQYASLCVTDTGTGMAPDVVARAFDPFFTTKPTGTGTGLGLSMVYGFARQSGGQVRIYSEVGQGTTVCIYLPRSSADAAEPEPPSQPGPVPTAEQASKITVLVVDDEPTVRMLVAEVLSDLGYAAIEAADGAAGLQIVQSNVRLDLLITDVGLPGGLNGRQVADAAREARPGLKVLLITGFAENAILGSGLIGPGMQVMTKPFAMDALAIRIRELILSTPA